MGNAISKKKLITENLFLKNKIINLESELLQFQSLNLIDIHDKVHNKLDCNLENLIFEGGGIKGIAFCGALKELNKYGLIKNIKRFGGSSVGSIYACLYAIGYTPDELELIIKNTNFKDLLDNQIGYIQDFYSLLNDYGYCRGNYFYNWIGTLIEKKTGNSDYSFNELWSSQRKELIITGTNLNTMTTQYYSHKNHPNMSIRDAIRISISIPFIFQPVIWNDDILIDGGLIDNYPIDLFDNKNEENDICDPNWKTLGLKINSYYSKNKCNEVSPRCNINGIQSYLYSIVNLFCRDSGDSQLNQTDWIRSVIIDTGNINTMQFDINDTDKNFLIEQGKIAVQKFINNRNKIKNTCNI